MGEGFKDKSLKIKDKSRKDKRVKCDE